MKVSAFMDIYESLNSILVTLFNDIMNIEEKALITDEFKDISVTDMHIIEAIGIGAVSYTHLDVYKRQVQVSVDIQCHNAVL